MRGRVHPKGLLSRDDRTVQRAEAFADLRERFRLRFHGHRSRAIEVVDLIFENPIITTNRVADHLDVTVQSALHYVRKLEEVDIVIEVSGNRRPLETMARPDALARTPATPSARPS